MLGTYEKGVREKTAEEGKEGILLALGRNASSLRRGVISAAKGSEDRVNYVPRRTATNRGQMAESPRAEEFAVLGSRRVHQRKKTLLKKA